MNNIEIIVKVGGEGGSICLYGYKDSNGDWLFSRESNEEALRGMLSEEDAKGISFSSKSKWVKGWDEALVLLNRYPWKQLYPLYLNEEFKEIVLNEVRNDPNNSSRLSQWENLKNRE